MVMHETTRVLCAALLSFGFAGAAVADPTYVEFSAPGAAGGTYSFTNNLNRGGDLVGYYFDDQFHSRGYLRTRTGGFTVVGGDNTQPWALNPLRMATGRSGLSGFVADAQGGITTFDVPGTDGTGVGTVPVAIDSDGDVAGQWGTSAPPTHGFVRDSEGNITSFDAPNAGTGQNQGTFVQAMSLQGRIAGYLTDSLRHNHGFVRLPNGAFKTIDVDGAMSFAGGTKIYAINLSNSVAGLYYDNTGDHGFVLDRQGNLAKFDIPGRSSMMVTGINKNNDVVGWYVAGFVHGFVRSGATGVVTLFDVPGAESTIAQSINDKGQIAGYYGDSSGNSYGFLRKP